MPAVRASAPIPDPCGKLREIIVAIITILGAGRMGAAVTWPLLDNGHEVRLVGTHLDDDIIRSLREECFHPGLRRHAPDGVQPYLLQRVTACPSRRRRRRERRQLARRAVGRPDPRAAAVAGRDRPLAHEGRGGRGRHAPRHARSARVGASGGRCRSQVSVNAVAGPVLAYELSGRRISATVFAGNDEANASRPARHLRQRLLPGLVLDRRRRGRGFCRAEERVRRRNRRSARDAGRCGRTRRDRRGNA